MMSPTNGDNDDNNRVLKESSKTSMLSMEMESLHPGATAVRKAQKPPHVCTQIWMLIKLHCEYYPKIFSTIGLIGLGILMYMAIEWSKPPLSRHKVTRDYSKINLDYNFKATQIDHWCLFGGDTACKCDDFTEPVPREENKGWLATHQANKDRIKPEYDYDVVFLGDDVIEEMNGNWYNMERPDGSRIRENFIKTFSVEAGGDLDGLALGITGDSAPNLLWRIQHGEMPEQLFSKVWWIAVGANDLARGGCSEEATVLGILRVAEEVYFNNPGSVVVIQGILPRSTTGDGSLSPHGSTKVPLFGKFHNDEYYAEKAAKTQQLWPSIQAVNKELADFCQEHGHIVYFDASNLFLGGVGNTYFKSKNLEIMSDLMPDFIHLGVQGHEVLAKVIKEEVQRIILDEDEDNDVEEKGDGNE